MNDISPTVAVIHAIEEIEETESTALPPLYESIDPDALDQICRSLESGHVSFTYSGYKVTVDEAMEVTIEPL